MNRVIAPLVTKYTSEYIEGLNAENFQLSVFSGSIELKNLQLKRSALAQLDLPVDVVRGTLSNLVIKIPWTNLSGQAVVAKVDELLLLVKPKSFGKFVSYIRLTSKQLRTANDSLNTIGGVQLLNDKNEPLPLAAVLVERKAQTSDYSHVLEDGQWKDMASWSGNSKEHLIVKLNRPACIKGIRFRTGGNEQSVDPVAWDIEGALSLDAKWAALDTSSPTRVDMPDERWAWSQPVRLVAPETQKEDTLKNKRTVLESHDAVQKMAGEQEDAKAASFTERLQETIINNVQIDISSIHVRFEDDVTNPGNVYTMGACLESLQVYSTTDKWERAFVSKLQDIVNKRVAIEKLGIYMDHSKILTHDMELAKWKEFMLAGISRRHTYLLTPLSLTTNLAMISSKGRAHRSPDQPAVSAHVNCESLGLGVNRNQVVSLLEVMQFVQKYSTLAKYHEVRPIDPVLVKPRSWWTFAKRCVIRSIREQRKVTDTTFAGKQKIMKEYIRAFKLMQKVPWLAQVKADSDEEKRYQHVLDCYEYHLPLDVLKAYRTTAQQQLSAGKALFDEKEKAKAARHKEKKKAQSWGSWLSGSAVEENEHEAKEHEEDIMNIDEEARKQLQDSIGWVDEVQAEEPESPHGKDFVKLFFEMNVSTISVVLSEKRTSDFGAMTFSGLALKLNQREGGMLSEVALRDFKIEDNNNKKNIVAVRKGEGDLLHVAYELSPPDGRADSALRMSGRGLDVWFDSLWLSRVVSLVQIPPEINLSSIEASTAAAMADLGSGATRGLLLALEERKSIALDIKIDGPKLWVPFGNKRLLEVNLGTLCVVSDVDKMRKARVLEGGDNVRDEDYYDRINLRLDGVFAALCEQSEDSTYNYLISDVNFGLVFENCLTPNSETLASSKLSGNIDSIGLYVSPSKLVGLLQASEVVTSWLSNPSGLSGDSDTSYTYSLRARDPVFVNPAHPTEKKESSWKDCSATFIPQAYKLMLESPGVSPMFFMIGENTTTEVCTEDGKVELVVTLPQVRTAEGAYIELRLRLQSAEAEELSHHIHTSKWALCEWKREREVQASKLKQVTDGPASPARDARESSCLTKINMQCDLGLNEVCLTLDSGERQVASIGMHQLGLKYVARPKDMSLDLVVGKFSVCDLLRDEKVAASDKVFLGLHDCGEVKAAQFVYHQASKGSPMDIAGKGIGTHLDLVCGQLFLDAERDTLSPLLGHLMEYGKVGSNKKQPIIYEETTAKVVKEVVKEASTDAMLVSVNMEEFSTRFRSDNTIKFTTSAARSTLKVMMVPDERMTVTAALGNFELTHHSDTHDHYRQLVACGKEGSMLEVDYTQLYKEASAEVPEYTANCKVRLGQCRIVYLQRIIAQLQRYFDVGYIMKDITAAEAVAGAVSSAASAAQEMAAAAAEQRSKSLSLMQFDVLVAKPIIVIPYSVMSGDYGEFIVGNLLFRTSLAEPQPGSWVELMDIRLDDTQLVLHDQRLESLGSLKSIVEDWSISFEGARVVVDASESLPAMKMKSTIGDIKITLTKAQYEALMSILNTNVLDTWMDDELAVVEAVAEGEGESAGASNAKAKEKEETADTAAKGTSLEFDLVFNNLTLALEVDKDGETLVAPTPLLTSHMTGLRVSHMGMADGSMESVIWLGHIGVTDSRPTASRHASRFFVFGSDTSSGDTVELFRRKASEAEEKMSVVLPAATLVVLPDLIGETMKFFVNEHSSYEAQDRYNLLKATVGKSKTVGDVYVTDTAWCKLESDLYLGPGHRLIARAVEGGRVVVDGCDKYKVFLTGSCNCSDAIQPPCDVQHSAIVVDNKTTLVFRNTKVCCLSVLEDYILPGSGKVIIDSETASLICKKHQVKKQAHASQAGKVWEFEAAMSKGFSIHLPEDTSNATSRMLVIGVEGRLSMVNELDGPGSSFIDFKTSNFAIYPSTLCGDNSKLQFHNVLGPSLIQYRSSTQVVDNVIDNSTFIEGQNCGVRISYKDVKVVLKAWGKLSKAMWGEQDSPTEEKMLIHVPEHTSGDEKVVTVAGGAKQVSKSSLRVNLDKFCFLIVDHYKGYDRELLRVLFDEQENNPYAVTYRMESTQDPLGDSKLDGDASLNVSIDYYNHTNSHWEPILEPYVCKATVTQEPTNSASIPAVTSVKLVGVNDVMDLNVSNDVIKNLMHVSTDWQRGLAELGTELESAHTHAHTHYYVLDNQLGLTLDVKGPFIDAVGIDPEAVGTVQTVSLKGSNFQYNACVEGGVDLSIDFGTCGLRPLKIMTSEVFQQFLVPKTKLDQRERMVYATTRQRSGQLVTTLTSRFVIHNKTSVPLEMQVQGSIVPIPAFNDIEGDGSSEVSVPLWALGAEHCGIEIRPANESNGHHWSVAGSKDDSRLSVTGSKPLSGNLTCGYIGQEVKDPLSFYFVRTVRETPCIKHGAELRVIEIKAPMKLENLLPVPIEVVLSHGEKMADIRARVCLQAGESKEVFTVSDNKIYATYHVMTPESGQQFTTSKPVLIHSDDLKTNSESPCVAITDEFTRRTCRLVLVNNCENTASAMREVSVYAPYWLVNLTHYDLLFVRDKDGKPLSNGLVKAESAEGVPPALLFSGNSDDAFGGKISVGLTPDDLSSPFSYDTVGVSGEARCKYEKKEVRFGVSIELAPGKFMRTKIVKLSQRWVFKNETSLSIALCRKFNNEPEELVLLKGEASGEVVFPFTYNNGSDVRAVLKIFGDDSWSESKQFNFSDLGTQFLALHHKTQGLRTFDCRAIQLGSINYVIFSDSTSPPLRVVNNTFHAFTIGDQGAKGQPELDVSAFSIAPYYPEKTEGTGVPVVRVRSPGVLDTSVELAIGPQEQRAHDSDVIAHIVLGHDSMLLVLEHESMRSDDSADSQIASLKFHFESSLSFSLIKGIGMDRHEIAYVYLGDVSLCYGQKSDALDLTVSVGILQIDNQMHNAIFPVLLTSISDNKLKTAKQRVEETKSTHADSERDDKVREALHFNIVDYSTRIGGMTTMGHCSVLLQELRLSVDDTFLMELLGYLGSVFVTESLTTEEIANAVKWLPEYNDDLHGASMSGKFYAGQLVLNPIKFVITFQAEQKMKSNKMEDMWNSALSTLTMAVTNIEDGVLKLDALIMSPASGSTVDISNAITQHYISSGIKAAYRLVGALEFLGNPVGLISNIGDGISDLFYEPVHGIKQSPGKFAVGIGKGLGSVGRHTAHGLLGSVGGITTSISKGVAQLSMDESYIKERRRRQRQKATTVGQGLEQGGMALGRGVFDGITGLVMKPIEGVKNHEGNKVVGLSLGIGRGIIGVPVKVVGGVLDAVGKAAEGAKGHVSGADLILRRRPPRAMIGGVIQEYCRLHACAHDMIRNLGLTDITALLVPYRIPGKDGKKQIYSAFTNHHIVLFDVENQGTRWTCSLVVDYKKIQEVTVTDATLIKLKVAGSKAVEVRMDNSKRYVYQVIELLGKIIPNVPLHQWVFPELSSSSTAYVETWENERRYMSGFTKTLLPTDRPMWSDAEGKEERLKSDMRHLPHNCVWLSDWEVVHKEADEAGWVYAQDFLFTWSGADSSEASVRRRRWVRKFGLYEDEQVRMSMMTNPESETLEKHSEVAEEGRQAVIQTFETYENQRSYPFVGFSGKMLLTDRGGWSSRNGKKKQPKDSFYPPEGFKWLGDWQVDKSSKTDGDGWEYAVDFPFEYHPSKSATHLVRRRRWVRRAVSSAGN